jgi:hypothetical protein
MHRLGFLTELMFLHFKISVETRLQDYLRRPAAARRHGSAAVQFESVLKGHGFTGCRKT